MPLGGFLNKAEKKKVRTTRGHAVETVVPRVEGGNAGVCGWLGRLAVMHVW